MSCITVSCFVYILCIMLLFCQKIQRSRASEQTPPGPPLFASPGDIFNLLKAIVWSGEQEKVRHANANAIILSQHHLMTTKHLDMQWRQKVFRCPSILLFVYCLQEKNKYKKNPNSFKMSVFNIVGFKFNK